MRETITFPRPYHRSMASVLFVALLGAVLLVLARPVSIHAGRTPDSRTALRHAAAPGDGALDVPAPAP